MKKISYKKILHICFVIAVLALVAIVCYIVGKPLIKFASEPEKFRIWIESNGILGELAYIGMMILQILAAFLPGEPFEIVAGYAFGAFKGTVLCLLAAGIGSAMVLLLVRKFGMKLVKLFFSEEKINSVKFLRSSPKRIILFTVIFILPGTPKDLLCYFAGLTDIKLSLLMIICSFGRIPSIITSTLGGDALGTESYIFAVVVFAVTAIISVSGIILYEYIRKKHEKKNKAIK